MRIEVGVTPLRWTLEMSCSTTGATGQEVLSRKSVNQARLRDSQSRSDRCVAVPGTRAGERVRSQRQWRDHGWRGGLPSPPLRWGLITAYRLDAVRVSVLAFARFPGSQMCLRFTKTSGRGYPPDPRTTSARHVDRHAKSRFGSRPEKGAERRGSIT